VYPVGAAALATLVAEVLALCVIFFGSNAMFKVAAGERALKHCLRLPDPDSAARALQDAEEEWDARTDERLLDGGQRTSGQTTKTDEQRARMTAKYGDRFAK
jgi:hypothetical protein